MNKEKFVILLLRLGVAFAFIYPAISAWIEPTNWIGYFPTWMKGFVPDAVLLHAFGLTEIIIGIWILYGKKIFIPSVLASLYLTAIIVLNWQSFDVIFRDVSILTASVALTIKASNKNLW